MTSPETTTPVAEPAHTWKHYQRAKTTEMRPWQKNDDMTGVSVSDADKENGSPQAGDMLARDPEKPTDQWLVSRDYFERHYVEVSEDA